MSSRGVAWPVAAALVAATLEFAMGCRAVIGADEFSVGERLDPCGELEVRAGSECVAVGVRDCGDGFSADGHGGCEPILPSAPCAPGTYARPGLTACSNLDLGCSSAQGQFGLITDPVGPIVYVGGTPPSGLRFDTIAEALAGTTGDVTIALAEGSHTANIEITGRRVQIVGVCPEVTAVVAGDSKPVIKIGPGGDGSRFERFAVTGKAPGIVVSSASDVKVLGLWLHDLDGAGITFDDVAGWAADDAQYRKASGSIERSLVDGATDVGVAIYGAEVSLSELQIANTRPVREGHRALGLSARASPYFTLPNGLPLEQAQRPSTIVANRVLIEGGRGAGVLLEGAGATFESVVVRGVEADLARHGRGIDVRAHVPGRIPTTLVMRHSLIENVFDVGLRSWNADSVVVEDSVIRDVGEAMTGRCLGNGVRARYDLLRDVGLEERLVLRHSLVERTRQAGVLVEGGYASIEGMLVRDTRREPCRNDFGDGVAVHASATGPSSTVLRRTRIEGAARAGVSSFRSNTSLESVMVLCSEFGLSATGPAIATEGALCGCKGDISTCPPSESFGPSLIGGAACDAGDATACYRGCSGTLLQSGSVLEEATAWVYDHDEIVSVLSDDKGCYDVEGLPPDEPALIAIAHDKHVSGLGMMAPLQSDSPAAYLVNLVQPSLLSAGAVIFGSPDLRSTYLMQVRVCSDPKEPRMPGDAICKSLPGLTASIEPGPAGPPIYFSTSAFPDATLKETVGADLAFHGVVPGEHSVTLHAPSGTSADCRPDTGGFGWSTSQTDRFRVLGEEGFPTILAAEVNCRVVAP